jgi:leucyl aminopeptidase
MKIETRLGRIEEIKAELLVIGLYQGEESLPEPLKRLDKALKGLIMKSIKSGEFRGKLCETLIFHTMGLIPARLLMIVGLGEREKYTLDSLRKAMATAAGKSREINIEAISAFADIYLDGGHKAGLITRTMIEGMWLGLYRYREYKVEKEEGKDIKGLQVVTEERRLRREMGSGARRGLILAESVGYVRDLNNRPGNRATPDHLAREARSIVRKYGVACKVLGVKEMERLKMGGMLAVGSGSRTQPRMIVLQHKGGRSAGDVVVLVGKGITFDSGGISIKPSLDMDKMKYDKSGGVAVMGVLVASARLGIPVNVTGIIPAVENLPGGSAYRPGDILTMGSGKTVEVISTDAEGRLILADALAYGRKFKPSVMIDIATLTGACVIALGTVAAGLMGNDEDVMRDLIEAGERTGEQLWRLPLWDEYREFLKSEVAELKNVGGRDGSVITAGMFLKEFVGDIHWAHLDIAGTAWATKGKPYVPRGPSGMGVRLLVEYLEMRAAGSRHTGKRKKAS